MERRFDDIVVNCTVIDKYNIFVNFSNTFFFYYSLSRLNFILVNYFRDACAFDSDSRSLVREMRVFSLYLTFYNRSILRRVSSVLLFINIYILNSWSPPIGGNGSLDESSSSIVVVTAVDINTIKTRGHL